jgi:hypothetical protein
MPGCYVSAREFADLDAWQRFALRGRAFALTHDAHLTGWAATVIRGLPTLGRPPALPTAVLLKRGRNGPPRSRYGRLVVANLPWEHQYSRGELSITSKSWSVADVVRTSRLPDGLLLADAAARLGIDCSEVTKHMAHWAGVGKLRWVARYATGNAESELESLGRFTFYEYNLPLPVVNAWVGKDEPRWRVDGLLPWHWWAEEGDGAVKYDNRPDASRIVRDQNEREYGLRRLGLDVLRYGWGDVYPHRFVAKVRQMFKEHPRRDQPVRWWKHVPGVGAIEPKREDWPSPYPAGIILPAGWREDLRDG